MPAAEIAAYLERLAAISPAEAKQLATTIRRANQSDTERGLANPRAARVLRRMFPDTADVPANIHRELPTDFSAEHFQTNLNHHARAVCTANRPRCARCPLISFCSTGRQRPVADAGKPVAVELFAGGGGLGEGFTRSGFDVALAVELDRDAAQTYRINHPGTVVLEADATTVEAEDLRRLVPRLSSATALIAGPPCQGYSAAGKRQAEDERNNLYTAVVRLAGTLKPRFVVIENVPGMRQVGGASYVQTVLDALDSAGYNASEQLLRACDYGVAQLRRRMIFLAQAKDLGAPPAAPAPTHCPGTHCEKRCGSKPGVNCGLLATPTVTQTLQGLPVLESGVVAEFLPLGAGQPPITNASTMKHSIAVVEKIAGIDAGSGPISYRRLHRDLARTIVAGHRALPVHPSLNRTISTREAARIQGFDDAHVFAGPRSKHPLQVANAVPPALARAIANALLATIRSSAERQGVDPDPLLRSTQDAPARAGAR